jgi:hypothetical protein
LGLYGKNGGYKPDFFCLTSSGECVIAESKGAIGPPSTLTSDKRKGKEQVSNVAPHGVPLRSNAGRLVFATNLRHAGENSRPDKDSCITVVDPDNEDEVLRIKVTPDEITLHSYCKLLALCGLQRLAWLLLRGISVGAGEPFSEQSVEIERYAVLPLLRTRRQLIGLEANVARILFRNREGIASEITHALAEQQIGSIYSTETALLLPNGIVYSSVE